MTKFHFRLTGTQYRQRWTTPRESKSSQTAHRRMCQARCRYQLLPVSNCVGGKELAPSFHNSIDIASQKSKVHSIFSIWEDCYRKWQRCGPGVSSTFIIHGPTAKSLGMDYIRFTTFLNQKMGYYQIRGGWNKCLHHVTTLEKDKLSAGLSDMVRRFGTLDRPYRPNYFMCPRISQTGIYIYIRVEYISELVQGVSSCPHFNI